MRAMHPKSAANRLLGIHRAKILPGRGPFCCTDPSNHTWGANLAREPPPHGPPRIMHGARILPFLGVSFGCCGRGEGRGGARGAGAAHAARAPPALCEAARCFRGFASCSFELSPPTRTMLLLPRPPSRETCPLPPPSEARTFRGALCEVSAFASRRWVCPSPSTRRLCLVRPFRGGARC